MTQVTNLSRRSLDFTVGVKNGEAVTEALAPGETRDLAIDVDSAQVKGRVLAELISLGKPSKATAKAAAAAAE